MFATLNTRVPCAIRDPRESEAVWIVGHRQNQGEVDRQALLLVNLYTDCLRERGRAERGSSPGHLACPHRSEQTGYVRSCSWFWEITSVLLWLHRPSGPVTGDGALLPFTSQQGYQLGLDACLCSRAASTASLIQLQLKQPPVLSFQIAVGGRARPT